MAALPRRPPDTPAPRHLKCPYCFGDFPSLYMHFEECTVRAEKLTQEANEPDPFTIARRYAPFANLNVEGARDSHAARVQFFTDFTSAIIRQGRQHRQHRQHLNRLAPAPTLPEHKVDDDLLKYSEKINKNAFVGFASVLILNFLYCVMYFVSIQRVFIFPLTESYFDIDDHGLSSWIYTFNWGLLICVVGTQLTLQEMCINYWSIARTVVMFLMLNMFGTIYSLFIMVPLLSVLNQTTSYKLKSRIAFFVNQTSPIVRESASSIQNDQYIRLIAVNHFLSKLCFKLQQYDLRKRNLSVNNVTVYHRVHQTLDRRLDNLETPGSAFTGQRVYEDCIQTQLDRQRMWHNFTFRVYAVAINVSLIRLLFFSKDLDLYTDHFWVFIAFWVKLALEIIGGVFIFGWCWYDDKLMRIGENVLKTRFYFIVLKMPEFKKIEGIVYDHMLVECRRFYEAWKYSIDCPVMRHCLDESKIHSVKGSVCEYLFEIRKPVRSLDIDESLWEKITTELDKSDD